ncbi:MAG TPA: hypothetical protein VKR22_08020 [Acidimicrobiales bacterium]|nr:hypothetical protein [Acidimicrobiales bacterium]
MTYTIDAMASGRSSALTAGTRVDVRSRFVGQWSRGFEVAEHVDAHGYRVRRLSDGAVLPDLFDEDELRPERRRNDFWWH